VVDAAGNSQMPIRYATTDHAPLPGLSYYRLRTVDLDGSFKLWVSGEYANATKADARKYNRTRPG